MTDQQPAEATSHGAAAFAQRYGPWAVVVGASEGVGAAFARDVAGLGVHVVLISRRQQALDGLAAEIREAFGVEARAVAVDLVEDDAVASIAAATSDLDVGLLMCCAGADPNYRSFLAQPVEDALSMTQRNCIVPLQLCHHYGAPMVARGSGGIVIVSSGAAFVGAPNMVAYGATKAFDMVMAEALWAELHGQGVDVLGLVLGLTDTPALRRLLADRGEPVDPSAPVPGAARAEDVAATAIAELANGPTVYAGDDVRMGAEHFGSMSRNDAVRLMIEVAGQSMGSDPEPDAEPDQEVVS